MPALSLKNIRKRVERLLTNETTSIKTNARSVLFIQRKGKGEFYAWRTRADKSMQSFSGSLEDLMKVVSELRRGIGQAKNKVRKH